MEQTITNAKQLDHNDKKFHSKYDLALQDISAASKLWKLWCHLGWNDIVMRYRGSVIGPFWITASMLVFIGAFSLVYSRLFHQPLSEYIPILTAGYLVWMLISSMLIESCNIFIDATPYITEIKFPYTMYIFRLGWRQLIILTHNAVVFVVVAIIFKLSFSWNLLYIIPGILLLMVNLVSFSLLIAMLATKYRDIPPVISSVLQVAFFVTPVSWAPQLLHNSLIIRLNPLYYFLDLVRSPLLGSAPNPLSWLVTLTITIVVFSMGFFLFAKYRRNIPFWL